jgi:flagellar hook-basal body complex protein FliE
MSIHALSLAGLTGPTADAAVRGPAGAGGASSVSLFQQLLDNAAHSHESADAALHDMAVGQTDNLHEVMLQMAQADLSFHLVLEIRNRLTDAYQEIMKMNV